MRPSREAANIIHEIIPDITPQIAIILGSGLSSFVDAIENKVTIPYDDIPSFPKVSVEGHPGRLTLGYLKDVPIACFQGRCHFYEGYSFLNEDAHTRTMTTPIRAMKLLGCQILLATNSAGSLREKIQTGNLVLISDHINFQGNNPLIGTSHDKEFGSYFVDMQNAYDPALRNLFHQAAERLRISLAEGIYMGVLGPSFETPAEIRAFQLLGADMVGMSTIPEVIIARQCELRVAAISVITNMAAGLRDQKLSHETTLKGASQGVHDLIQLITGFIELIAKNLSAKGAREQFQGKGGAVT